MNFETFALHPQINAGISAAGYTSPTPIQQRSIPAILEGRDVLGLAQTGTGKTAAFVLPILQKLLKGPRGKLRVLILSQRASWLSKPTVLSRCWAAGPGCAA